MGVLVYILGRSGTGKSYSISKFAPDEVGIVNVQGKILPFKGSGKYDVYNTDNSSEILDQIENMAQTHKSIVVDDFQYVMANEFMRRVAEKGYDKFSEIAKHAWDIADAVKTLPADVIVYVMCHTDTDQDGFEKLKTIGKLLDEKIVLEGMSTIVLKTAVSDGQYMFLTQNNGKDTVKSPAGMFPSYAIDNDLKYVDQKIRSYYELGDYIAEEDMAEADAAVSHEEIQKEEPKRRRSRGKKEEEKSSEAPEEETETEEPVRPKRRRNRTEEPVEPEEPEETKDNPEDDGFVDMEDITAEDIEPPKRKRRVRDMSKVPIMAEPEDEAPKRRNLRRK